MFRTLSVALALLILPCHVVSAQQWAEKMFKTTTHDFGAVARSAKVEYRFAFKNLYKEEVHIASVRSSCGCTSPSVVKETLASGEESAILAAFNTNRFTGQRGARLTVTIDKPFFAEVTLQVSGYIRTDVVVNPSQVTLGTIDQGQGAEKFVAIEYAGRGDWKILEVKNTLPFVQATIEERSRSAGRASYVLRVKLDPSAPAGYLQQELTVVTNDQRAKQFPVMVEGLIAAPITISPTPLVLGTIQPHQSVTKTVVVRGRKPFKILGLDGTDANISVKPADEAKLVHLVPLTFTANAETGKIVRKLQLKTDLPGSESVEFTLMADVAAALAGQ